jgi:predicted enzyme related to lactoylglutathione lyase
MSKTGTSKTAVSTTGMRSPSSEFAVQPILSTNDIGRLSSFYAALFGAEEDLRVPGRKGPFFVTLRFGEASLALVAHKRGADAVPGRVAVAVFVENVDDLLPRVKPAGGKVRGPAKDMPWGHRVAHITDPDGNPINLTQQL